MNQRPGFVKRKYFINKEFQGKLIFRYFLLIAIASVFFVGLFSFFSSNTLSISYDDYNLRLGVTPGILFKKIISTQWIFIVVGGAAVIVMTLMFSHRVAGPFFRFERSLNEMIEGNISNRIILRQKDEGKALAQKINEFNAALEDKLKQIGKHNHMVLSTTKELEKELLQSNVNISAVEPLFKKLNHSHKNISQIIDEFQIQEKPPGE